MLKDTDIIATIAVKNLEAAKTFYGGTLGLSRSRAATAHSFCMRRRTDGNILHIVSR